MAHEIGNDATKAAKTMTTIQPNIRKYIGIGSDFLIPESSCFVINFTNYNLNRKNSCRPNGSWLVRNEKSERSF